MELRPKVVYFSVFVVWVFAVVVLIIIAGPRELVRQSRPFGWETAKAVVARTEPQEANPANDQPASLHVTLEYEVDGQTYSTTRVLPVSRTFNPSELAELFYQPGDVVECRVRPGHPDEIVVREEFANFEAVLFLIVAMSIMAVVGSVGWAWWLRHERTILKTRTWFVAGRLGWLLVSGFILVTAGTATFRGFRDAGRIVDTLGWQEHEATIQTCDFIKVRDGQSWNFQVDLRYIYNVNGQAFEGTEWSLFDRQRESTRDMRQNLRGMKAGDVATCYVDMKNPQHAILERGTWQLSGLILIVPFWAMAAWTFATNLRELWQFCSRRTE